MGELCAEMSDMVADEEPVGRAERMGDSGFGVAERCGSGMRGSEP